MNVMFKKCLMLLALALVMPAHAGEVENALAKGDNVFLYLYSPRCKYCTMFSPMYNRLTKTHNGQYSFFKIDSGSKYGNSLMYEYGGTYVPYVVLMNEKKKKALHIPPQCLMDSVCLQTEMNAFRK